MLSMEDQLKVGTGERERRGDRAVSSTRRCVVQVSSVGQSGGWGEATEDL